MEWSLLFFFNSVLLGVGLAMDAFSVSLANGLNEPDMRRNKVCRIAGVFAFFQAAMPMAGWICVHTILIYFQMFEKLIPWIALLLLLYIGGKMMIEGIKNQDGEEAKTGVGMKALLIQGIATSIDALSVGFTIAEYGLCMALVCSLIIAAVTFVISAAGLIMGKRFGTRLSNKAAILGGVILIGIGLEIFITGVF
ncbi:MAG: manganese efflux pump [Lachnospiraceae bacterium]|nr:manganese efflux pump [Lachnospiraceae bacterium]